MTDLLDAAIWSAAETTGLVVDHLGLVVPDVAPAIDFFRTRGFALTDPTPLQGDRGPLGQVSAHLMLPNAYLEISAPIPDASNHLDPYLARGPGLRILALASDDIGRDHARLAAAGLAAGPPRPSARQVALAAGPATARFEWFPLRADAWPEVLVAVVRHLTPDIAFAPELCRHPNGAVRLSDVVAEGDWSAAATAYDGGDLPAFRTVPAPRTAILGLSIAVPGAMPAVEAGDGFLLRTVAA